MARNALQHSPFQTFGLDISSRAIRFAFIDQAKRRLHVRAASEEALPQGLIEGGVILDAGRLTAAVKEVMTGARRHHLPKYVVASLPDQQCFIVTVALTLESGEERSEAIQWEAAQHMPFSAEELYYDWAILSETNGTTVVQVAASPKTCVDSYLGVLEGAGLTPVRLEAASLASLRALQEPTTEHPYFFLSIGWSSTTMLYVTQKGVPMTVVTPTFSGQRLTDILVERLKLKPAEAEKAKSVCGLDPACSQGVVRHAILPEWKLLLEEMQRLQDYAVQQNGQEPCTDIVVTGSHSGIRSIAEELRLKTHLTVHETTLRETFSLGSQEHPLLRESDYATFATALGLATPIL